MKIYFLITPANTVFLLLGISALIMVLVYFLSRKKTESRTETDVVPDENAVVYITALLKKLPVTLVGTRLSKGRLWTIGDELLPLTDPINEVEEGEYFEGENFFRVLVLGEGLEEYLYVHQASGEYCILHQDDRRVVFSPEEIQPIHCSFVDPTPSEKETREDGTNEGAEYEGTQEGVKQNVKGKHDDWDHHHASYP